MKKFIAGAALALFGPPNIALAEEIKCTSGSQAPIELIDWSVELENTGFGDAADTVVNVRNQTGNDIVALDGRIHFFDPLDRISGTIGLPDIQAIAADEVFAISGLYSSDQLMRLATIDPALVTVIV